ncbi:MAG: sodium-translocating pyrophosphatase [Methanocellales archaeon]|nr:sodium-translocating pyrophosphatase [Methanocellales archaeon]
MDLILFALIVGIVSLIFAAFLARNVLKQDAGTPEMIEISDAIQEGAMAFLNREYKMLIGFVVIVSAVIAATIGIETALTFVIGAFASALAGNIGMRVATKSNARTANACREGLGAGLKIAFSSGAVMGLAVVGLGLLGVSGMYYIFGDPAVLFGFGFGASSIALFARVGGGIYTKAADVGADLVGKVEKGIPEDDPRNPAVIADNVGDNVGDVAGMGADLFESYVSSIIATMAIGLAAYLAGDMGPDAMVLPLLLAGVGIISSIIGTFFVGVGNDANLSAAMNKGIYASAVFMAIMAYVVVMVVLGDVGVFYATIVGLIAGILIGLSTEYYTSPDRAPVQRIAESSQTGAGTNIIRGMSVSMHSTLPPIIVVCLAIILAHHFAGLYGVAIAAVGMLSTLGITLAADTYGPVADNAAGIAEMARMGPEIRERAEALDAVGNTTAAIGKGFAIGSAALTALALFSAYRMVIGLETIDVTKPSVIAGVFIGGMLPFLFSAITMESVGKAAFQIVNEVRRQFKEIPGLMEGTAKPDYVKCIDVSTVVALREMGVPGMLAIAVPLAVGMILGPEALGGLLVGAIVTGFLLAIMMANAGGAWDNAKKYIEAGNLGGKGTKTHAAAVIGDTVGDPFKDTSGPSLNILIKLMGIVALVFAPLFI